ncbi:MAG: hypothetical protein KAH06_05435 [Desulfobacterales bacterium]|nr:hypothetical protein [Desulfobacterales bacterium]
MAKLGNEVLDAALNYIDTNTTVLHICTQEPTVFGTLYSCGTKTPPEISVSGERGAGGREIDISAITDGTVTATATATNYALVSGTVLIATGALSSSQAVTSGNTFTLDAFKIGIPDPA